MITVSQPNVIAQAYHAALTTSLEVITKSLQEMLSRRVTAFIAGVDVKTVTRWASGKTTDVRDDSEIRLRTAYEIAQLLSHVDSPEVARAWFIGLSPYLDDISPAEAIHEGKLKEVRAAARAFVVGGA